MQNSRFEQSEKVRLERDKNIEFIQGNVKMHAADMVSLTLLSRLLLLMQGNVKMLGIDGITNVVVKVLMQGSVKMQGRDDTTNVVDDAGDMAPLMLLSKLLLLMQGT